jgi:uncharacterized membrane protein YadS
MTTGNEIQATELGSPWYRNFWPWFILGLLALSVVASLTSVAIAYRYRDVDVRIPVPEAAPSHAEPPAPGG